MKIIYILPFLLLFIHCVNGQTPSDTTKGKIIMINETSSEPKGGYLEFVKYLNSNLRYPKDARKKSKEGMVLVEFIVSSDGTIKPESVLIIKGVYESLDNEAKRVIISSPKWTPGTREGQPIEMKLVIPINFIL